MALNHESPGRDTKNNYSFQDVVLEKIEKISWRGMVNIDGSVKKNKDKRIF